MKRSMLIDTASGRLLSALMLSLLLAACSSNDSEEELGPAPLIEFEAEKVFDKLWSRSVGDGQGDLYNRLTPAISDGVIFVASADGEVEAFATEGGKSLWDVDLDTVLSGGVGVGEQLVLLGSTTGQVIALNRDSGEQLWRSSVGGEVLAPPQTNGELVVVQTFDGQLLALSADSGERVWSFRSTVPVLTLRGTSTPLIYSDQVVAGFATGKVMGFDIETGKVNWDVRVAAAKGHSEIERIVDVDGEMLEDSGTLYAVSYQGAVIAIDLRSGRRMWSREASSYVGMSAGFGNIYVAGHEGSVTAFIKTGQGVRWEQTMLARRKLSASATLGSYTVVGDVEGYLHALSQVDGDMAARTRVDSDGIQARLLVEDDTLYVYGNSGKLVAYQLKDKSSGWFW